MRYGNLLTLPVGGGLLYVEPVYIERANQQGAFPQLNRVLVAYGDRIGYAPTLGSALNQVLGAGAATTPPGQQTTAPNQGSPPLGGAGPGTVSPALRQAVTAIADALNRLRQAQAAGDFAAQGKALADLDAATKEFDTAAASR